MVTPGRIRDRPTGELVVIILTCIVGSFVILSGAGSFLIVVKIGGDVSSVIDSLSAIVTTIVGAIIGYIAGRPPTPPPTPPALTPTQRGEPDGSES